ncbi:MAG: hypothetical protein KatS3mg057_0503 [Herpetosiphonaceae bacterium]|nr:MAG: hypothetical protein KatS3mg057_0503 [Herpetosiphonaceae bacterium]
MLLVVGATGQLGGLVTHRLLEEGWPVRILVRRDSPSEVLARQGLATSADILIAAGAQPVYGDLKEPSSLAETCRNVDAVITTANAAARSGRDTVETVDRQGNRNLIEAAKTAGVKHFIFVSAQWADIESPVALLSAKAETEAYLQASGLEYTIIAPNAFMEIWITLMVTLPVLQNRPVTVVGSGDRKHAFIAMADVAAFILAALDNPAARNRRFVLGGPEALSFRDAAALFERVLGRSIPVHSVASGEPIPGLPEQVWPMAASFDSFDSPVDMSGTVRTFGVTLTPLEAFVRHQLAKIV